MKKILFLVFVLLVCFVSFAQAQTTTSSTTVTVSQEEAYTKEQKEIFALYCGTRQYKPPKEPWGNNNIGKYCQPFPIRTFLLKRT